MYANFGLDEVGLTDGDFACRRALVKKYITEFDTNRLMHTFRINAGMVSSAEPLGGWEAVEVGLRGHLAGHFLSACAKFGFGDRDEVLKAKALEIIDIMELCAKPNGYLSAFEEDTLDILEFEENRNVWAPYYTLHKIIQGLVDCHICLGSSKAMTLALNLAHYIRRRFEKLSLWKIDGILRCTKLNPVNEFGGLATPCTPCMRSQEIPSSLSWPSCSTGIISWSPWQPVRMYLITCMPTLTYPWFLLRCTVITLWGGEVQVGVFEFL